MNEKLNFSDADAYHSAIVRIATVRDFSENRPAHLLFASVEMITSSRPVPDTMPVNDKDVPQIHKISELKLELAFRKVAMNAAEAVTWYRSLQTQPTLPIPRCGSDQGRFDGTNIQASELTDEPTWPLSSTPLADPSLFGSSDDLYPTPFLGSGAYPAKVHRQLAISAPFAEQLSISSKACKWLQRRIHFDISKYSELLGSAIIVIPDPDVRTVSTFMTRDANGNEHLVGEVRPRYGRSLSGLTLTLFEERFGAMQIFKNFEVHNDLMIAPTIGQLEHTGFALSHADRGLISQQKAIPYIRNIGLQMNTISRRVRVETQDDRKKDSLPAMHEINEVRRVSDSIVGLETEIQTKQDTASRFYTNAARRRALRNAQNQQLQWFDKRDAALHFIRGQIGSAREKIMIVDPYADGLDLFNFGHFVTRTDITLKLLTSRLPFENNKAMLESFSNTISTFENRGLPKPEVKILRGRKEPPIHDRFLIIDDEVWLSGNSLNAIGSRASVILKLPDSTDIRIRLEQFFTNARELQFRETN